MVRYARAADESTIDLGSPARDYPATFAIFVLARSHRARAAALLSQLGLHPGQELILMRLDDCDGRTQNDLARTLGLDHSTIARSVARLQTAGHVTRSRSDTDGRATVVQLTDSGRSLVGQVRRLWAELEQNARLALPGDDFTDFLRLTAATAARFVDEGGPK